MIITAIRLFHTTNMNFENSTYIEVMKKVNLFFITPIYEVLKKKFSMI